MSDPPWLAVWTELWFTLAAGTTAIVCLAALAARAASSAAWQRAAWQGSTIALVTLVVGEATGVTRGIVQWSRLQIGRSRAADDTTGRLAPAMRAATRSAEGSAYAERSAYAISAAREASQPPLETPSNAAAAADEPVFDRDAWELDSMTTEPEWRAFVTFDLSPALPIDGSQAFESRFGVLRAPWWSWLAVVWLFGALVVAARVLFGRVTLWAFRRRHLPIHDAGLVDRVGRVAQRLGVRRRVWMTEASGLAGPIAFGIVRPTIVVPAGFACRFDASQQLAMLAHEMAHLAARDPAWHLVADLTVAALWWHPLAWWSRRELRAASEFAADEASLSVRDGPGVLAACLVEFGVQLVRPRRAAAVRIEGNGFRSSLGRRVERLLKLDGLTWRPPGRTASFLTKTLGTVAMVAAALCATAWSRPTDSAKGETMMETMKRSWRQSLAAFALVTVLAPADAAVRADTPADAAPADAAFAQDGEAGFKEALAQKQALEGAERGKRKENLEALERQISELRKAGKSDAAEKLAEEFKELAAQLDGKRSSQEGDAIDELRARIKQLEAENAKLREHARELGGRAEREEIIKKRVQEAMKARDEYKAKMSRAQDEYKARIDGKEGPQAEMHEKLEAMKRAIEKLRDAGQKEQAEKMAQSARELAESLEWQADGKGRERFGSPADFMKKIGPLSQELAKLHAAGRHEEAKEVEKQIEHAAEEWGRHWERFGKQWEQSGKQWEEWGKQYEAAAKRMADDYAQQGKKSVFEKGHDKPASQPPSGELGQVLKELREEINRLRDEVAELRRAVKGSDEKRSR